MKTTRIAAAALTATAAVAVPTLAHADSCSVTWGSRPKVAVTDTHRVLLAVRAGRHACYDRLVLDLDRPGEGYRVQYVRAVHSQGQGAVVPLRGGAFIEVDDQSTATHRLPMPAVTGYTTFRQVGWGGSFEGYTTVGLGVRARLPFRVFRYQNHLVIDVAHHW